MDIAFSDKVTPPKGRATEAPIGAGLAAATRLDAEQSLWGKGNFSPGAQNLALETAAILKLTKEKDVAVFGSGLCGTARDLAAATGGRITAYEWDEDLIAGANIQNAQFRTGFQIKQVPVKLGADMALGKRYDALICADRLHPNKNRIALLYMLAAAVKGGGVLLVTDYTLGDAPMSDALRDACFAPLRDMQWPLWTGADVQAALSEAGFAVEAVEDITPRYRKYIVETFARMKDIVLKVVGKNSAHESEVGPHLAACVRRWAARHDAMKAGSLKVQRFIALRAPGEKCAPVPSWRA